MSQSPERRALTEAVYQVMDDVGEGDIAIVNIVRDVKRHHPDECAAVADAAVDDLIHKITKRRLKPSTDSGVRLSGFDLPPRLPLLIEGGPVWRYTSHCTEADLDAYEVMLRDQIKADQSALRSFSKEKRRVVQLLHAHGVDTLADLPA